MKDQRIRELLKKRLPLCLKTQNFPVLTVPDIPEKQLMNMTKKLSVREDIISMCDTSLFGKGKNGIAFTEKAVYFKDTLSGVKSCHFTENWTAGESDVFDVLGITPSNTFFDCFALTDLINELAAIAAQNSEEPLLPEEQPAPAPAVTAESEEATVKKDDDDDDDDVSFLDLLDIALDVTEDPSR